MALNFNRLLISAYRAVPVWAVVCGSVCAPVLAQTPREPTTPVLIRPDAVAAGPEAKLEHLACRRVVLLAVLAVAFGAPSPPAGGAPASRGGRRSGPGLTAAVADRIAAAAKNSD